MELSPELEQRLKKLVEVFLEENSKINLSAFRTPELCWMGNVMDSLALLDILQELSKGNPALSIMDLGTGGGFPLLPLAICLPEARLVGVDSVKKKLDAVGRIAQTMELANIELITGRAEELGRDKKLREQFDIVTARAVAPINTLLEYCAPFVKKGGQVIFWKSLDIEQELKDSLLARAELSCHLIKQHRYSLGEEWGERQLLIFEKASALPKKYPREVGVPKKDPL